MTDTTSASPRRGGARSRQGGVPTTLPAAVPPAERQLALPLPGVVERHCGPVRSKVLPGVVHVTGWLDLAAQQALAQDFRRWAAPPAGLRHPRVPTGHLMSVQSVCLGWHWQPYAYSRTADDTDGAPVKPMPANLIELGRAAVGAAYGESGPDAATQAATEAATEAGTTAATEAATEAGTTAATEAGTDARVYAPDAAIVNLYAPGARLGLHQDGEEPSSAPVVTISLGDTATFRMAGVDRRTGPFTDVELHSGDLLVFGGPNRRIFHGVPKVASGSGPEGLGLPPGRLSITLRETGLVAGPP
jgi:DNA oxidative demethylase